MAQFKKGDLALHVRPGSKFHLEIVEIGSDLMPYDVKGFGIVDAYLISDPQHPEFPEKDWASTPEYLRPLPPDNEKGSWDDCLFKPKELERVEPVRLRERVEPDREHTETAHRG